MEKDLHVDLALYSRRLTCLVNICVDIHFQKLTYVWNMFFKLMKS